MHLRYGLFVRTCSVPVTLVAAAPALPSYFLCGNRSRNALMINASEPHPHSTATGMLMTRGKKTAKTAVHRSRKAAMVTIGASAEPRSWGFVIAALTVLPIVRTPVAARPALPRVDPRGDR